MLTYNYRMNSVNALLLQHSPMVAEELMGYSPSLREEVFSETRDGFIVGCSEVGPVHYEQSTLGQVLSPRAPCAQDEVGSISLQAAVELGASSSSMLIMLSNCTGEADQFDRLGAVR